ncbi:MAG: hypothetical protein KDE45_17255, partial [Caldilineaceae bacterium]|nr:hypothetical protein [Caldilineaceae bacterium]
MIMLDALAPDLILHNGSIYTMDAAAPSAEAIAVKDGRVLLAGASAALLPLAAPHTRVVDL